MLKRFREGVLIHDATYHVAVQLEGPEVRQIQMLYQLLTYIIG